MGVNENLCKGMQNKYYIKYKRGFSQLLAIIVFNPGIYNTKKYKEIKSMGILYRKSGILCTFILHIHLNKKHLYEAHFTFNPGPAAPFCNGTE